MCMRLPRYFGISWHSHIVGETIDKEHLFSNLITHGSVELIDYESEVINVVSLQITPWQKDPKHSSSEYSIVLQVD